MQNLIRLVLGNDYLLPARVGNRQLLGIVSSILEIDDHLGISVKVYTSRARGELQEAFQNFLIGLSDISPEPPIVELRSPLEIDIVYNNLRRYFLDTRRDGPKLIRPYPPPHNSEIQHRVEPLSKGLHNLLEPVHQQHL